MDKEKYPKLAERLKELVPEARIDWARELAMDLAVGFNEKAWSNSVSFTKTLKLMDVNDEALEKLLIEKWKVLDHSDCVNLKEQGYIRHVGNLQFQLTVKATNLVRAPIISPTVFISYKHGSDPSATLALLIDKHISEKTNAISYHDESLRKSISKELKEEIERSATLVCILGQDSLQRDSYVRVEIDLARKCKKQIEFFWLKSYKRDPIDEKPDELKEWVDDQLAVRVLDESTKGYNTALNELIDRLCKSDYISKRL